MKRLTRMGDAEWEIQAAAFCEMHCRLPTGDWEADFERWAESKWFSDRDRWAIRWTVRDMLLADGTLVYTDPLDAA